MEGTIMAAGYDGEERRERCAQGAAMESEVDNLKRYQLVQNGNLRTIRNQLWGLVMMMLATLGAVVFSMLQQLANRA